MVLFYNFTYCYSLNVNPQMHVLRSNPQSNAIRRDIGEVIRAPGWIFHHWAFTEEAKRSLPGPLCHVKIEVCDPEEGPRRAGTLI